MPGITAGYTVCTQDPLNLLVAVSKMSGRGIWSHADIVKHSKIHPKQTETSVILSYCIRGLAKTKVMGGVSLLQHSEPSPHNNCYFYQLIYQSCRSQAFLALSKNPVPDPAYRFAQLTIWGMNGAFPHSYFCISTPIIKFPRQMTNF